MKESGVTLVELLIVASVIGILIIVMGFSYEGWIGNYKLESMTKELYFDLMDARSSAMTKNRVHWAILNTTQYTVIEDSNPNPDGNGVLEGADNQVFQKRYGDYNLGVVGAAALPQTITFDRRGLMSWVPAQTEMTFRFINTRDPDYDCIVIEQSKIWMGEYDTNGAICERR